MTPIKDNNPQTHHVYIIGCKSIGLYGGFETFVMQLLARHKDHPRIRYHVTCKANGEGCMDVKKLPGAVLTGSCTSVQGGNQVPAQGNREFTYGSVHGVLIRVSEIGAAQAIDYDLKALKWVCQHIETNHISDPVVYILACRIGPFEKRYVERIHAAGGLVFQNPDGLEHRRGKWNALIRRYWKLSERYAVKYADLIVCDSRHIEAYIRKEYAGYRPKTTYIAYGADVTVSVTSDEAEKDLSKAMLSARSEVTSSEQSEDATETRFRNWKTLHSITGAYYLAVGRFVPENNYEIMLLEFMNSRTEKDLVIIATGNPRFERKLRNKLHYREDKRIRFVGTVYDTALLKKIREEAFGYLHGHEVGGTNPSLLEALASTNLNLILGVGFNREVAGKAALYWKKEAGSLAALINKADRMEPAAIGRLGEQARARIRSRYSWERVCGAYEELFKHGPGKEASNRL